MLGDKTILEPARTYLTIAKRTTDIPSLLGRRAAILGLGLAGSQEAIPILANSGKQNKHIACEAILAMSLCQAFNMTDCLIDLMNDSDKPGPRAFAARCLGELFTQSRPSRLSRLTNGRNYMMKIPRLIPYQAMGNEFLPGRLLPAFKFENTWD